MRLHGPLQRSILRPDCRGVHANIHGNGSPTRLSQTEVKMSSITRRGFLKTGLAAGAMATTGILPLAAKRTAADTVVLGRSKVETTRLAFGTGTNSGTVQAALGQQEFTRVVRYAYDRGIRFFETAEAYETPGMLGEAL